MQSKPRVSDLQTIRDALDKLAFPRLAILNDNEAGVASWLFRWFALYRNITRDPLPRPTGTACELTLMLDLMVPAYFDYCMRKELYAQMTRVLGVMPREVLALIGQLKRRVWARAASKALEQPPPPPQPTLMLVHDDDEPPRKRGAPNMQADDYTADDEPRAWPSQAAWLAAQRVHVASLQFGLADGMLPDTAPLDDIFQWFSLYRGLARDGFPQPAGTSFMEIVLMMDLVNGALLHYDQCEHTRARMDRYITDPPPLRGLVRAVRCATWAQRVTIFD